MSALASPGIVDLIWRLSLRSTSADNPSVLSAGARIILLCRWISKQTLINAKRCSAEPSLPHLHFFPPKTLPARGEDEVTREAWSVLFSASLSIAFRSAPPAVSAAA